MCGIAGWWPLRASGAAGVEQGVHAMIDAIRHRGPDDAGVWVSPETALGLGHRRLSIIDLSQAGHQPMASAGGRFVISFNGEIYNHAELRSRLEQEGSSPPWRGHSDTETLLAAFEQWGIEVTLERSVGMFAIALWDRREQALYLIRDRFGEKPLYYGWTAPGDFVFASELKALRRAPGFERSVCREALSQYVRFSYVPAPRSIYQRTYKLEPGTYLRMQGTAPAPFPARALRPGQTVGALCIRRWWSLSRVVEQGATTQITDEREAVDALESALASAVRLQSVADVPLGAFLSGGVDSSTVVALMQRQSMRKVSTFTVGFEDTAFDESLHGRLVAERLGTHHTEVLVTTAEAQSVIPLLGTMYDEPFADSSQVPTYLVCRAARGRVTVAMSGDAGDELFGGYNRYLWGPRIWKWFGWLAYDVRRALGSAMARVPASGWDLAGRTFNSAVQQGAGVSNMSAKALKLAARLRDMRDLDDLYLGLVSEWQDPSSIVLAGESPLSEPPSLLADPAPWTENPDAAELMMYRDAMTYLPDDILCKVDRAAMAVGLETRVPFLDHRVAELAWRLPPHMKIRHGQGKWALRQVLYRHLPPNVVDRPKAGFALPLGSWLRGPLRHWCEELLSESTLRQQGYLRPEPIRKRWAQHLAGAYDHTPSIWSALMFQAWLKESD